MKLCHIVPSLEERHGGPSKSVRALANAQASLGESVELLATLEPGQPPLAAAGDAARIEVFPREAPQWLCRSTGLAAHLRTTSCEVVHNHALWLLPLHYAHETAHRRQVPLVISPRGMLSGWAYEHRRWRKVISELLVHPGAFAHAAGWHATSPEEHDDIRALGFKQPVCVSPNGVPLPVDADLAAARAAWHELCPATQTRPVALFYSRFHRKKRLRELIDLWLSAPRGDWLLLIVGVAEDYTAAELTTSISAAGATDRVAVCDGAGRPPPYAVASLLRPPLALREFRPRDRGGSRRRRAGAGDRYDAVVRPGGERLRLVRAVGELRRRARHRPRHTAGGTGRHGPPGPRLGRARIFLGPGGRAAARVLPPPPR
jgi:glycosyltransferase involved in cell wall biosynthesis